MESCPPGRRPWFNWTVVSAIVVVLTIVIAYWYFVGESAERLVERGQEALAEGAFSNAMDYAERAIHHAPKLASGWKLLAESASRNAHWDRACEALEEFSRLRPDDAGQLGMQLARNWVRKNRIHPAIRALKVSEKVGTNLLESLQLQAELATLTGHPRESVRCLVELLKRGISPTAEQVSGHSGQHQRLEWLKREVYTKRNLLLLTSIFPFLDDPEFLEAILRADPTYRSPLMAKAIIQTYLNPFERAEEILIEITTAHPDDLEAQGSLAELYAMYFPEKFLKWHSQLPPQAVDDARVWSARGKWLAQAGKVEPAIRCLHEALLREPEQISTTSLLGQLLKSIGETQLADAFGNRLRQLHRIDELNNWLREERANDWTLEMIEELEATGRLWEAWGWCVVHEQTETQANPAILSCKTRLESQVRADFPRTRPGSLPGSLDSWKRFPLPDWSQLEYREPTAPAFASHSTIRFEDQAERVGLDFRFVCTYRAEKGRRIYESTGAGVGVLDYDLDGWPDLYFPQGKGAPLESSDGPSDMLYRNLVGKSFQSVTALAGIHETSYSQGVAVGDFDNDGFPDIYVANLGRNRLYRNNGDGTFFDATDNAGLRQDLWTVSCAIADLNGDGLPELFDVNYIRGAELFTKVCTSPHGRLSLCRPNLFDPALDTVAINLGDGRFQEQQSECGLALPEGLGLGLLVADFNDDRRLDVYIANDTTANYLLMNEQSDPNRQLHFRDEAFLRGVALDSGGLAQGSMGVASADLNRDGMLDLLVTNFVWETNTLYMSQPGGFYQAQSARAGLREPSFEMSGWGAQFLDADRDGWFDLMVVNSHVDDYGNQKFRMRPQFFRGLPDGRFTELFARDAGQLFEKPRLSRGLALFDWNRDGQTDFVATDLEGPVILGVNRTESPYHSLRLKLVGTQSSRDAIGAKVKVWVTSADERTAQLTAGDGYESSNERFIEIGVGDAERITRVEIHWPSGMVSTAVDVVAQSEWLVIEGQTVWWKRRPD